MAYDYATEEYLLSCDRCEQTRVRVPKAQVKDRKSITVVCWACRQDEEDKKTWQTQRDGISPMRGAE